MRRGCSLFVNFILIIISYSHKTAQQQLFLLNKYVRICAGNHVITETIIMPTYTSTTHKREQTGRR